MREWEVTDTCKAVRVIRKKNQYLGWELNPDCQICTLSLCRLSYQDPHFDHNIQPCFIRLTLPALQVSVTSPSLIKPPSGIEQFLCSPVHPASRNQVKGQNQLDDKLFCVTNGNQLGRAVALLVAQFARNWAKNGTTGFSLFILLYLEEVPWPEISLHQSSIDM